MDDKVAAMDPAVGHFLRNEPASPPPCPKCQGTRQRRYTGDRARFWHCLDCDAARKRRLSTAKKIRKAQRCAQCGEQDWFPSGDCRPCVLRHAAERGHRLLADEYPDYAERVVAALPESDRTRYFANLSKGRKRIGFNVVAPLPPSRIFPGLNPSLDDRLLREGRARDVACCQAIAQVPPSDQREFYERYVKNPALAQRWARVERYKRPLIAGDKQDDLIWKLFTIIRLQMEMLAEGRTWALAGVGRSLVQQAGFLDAITERRRLVEVLSTYGSMLAHGEDVGDVMHPPWPADNPRKDR